MLQFCFLEVLIGKIVKRLTRHTFTLLPNVGLQELSSFRYALAYYPVAELLPVSRVFDAAIVIVLRREVRSLIVAGWRVRALG